MNPVPGTVVDEFMSMKKKSERLFEFYLIANATPVGPSHPVHYDVAYNTTILTHN